ncbi:unnamed protein product, partial [Staurois parvus]
MNGPVVFWDLSHAPKDYDVVREDNFRLHRQLDRKWERVPVKFGYRPPQRCQSLMGRRLQRMFHFGWSSTLS